MLILFLPVMFYGTVVELLKRRISERTKGLLDLIFFQLAGIVVLEYLVSSTPLPDNVRRVFSWLITKLGLELTQFLIALTVTAIGVAAFSFKRKNKKWYGNVEVIVGILSAFFVARSMGPNKFDLAKWSTLAGCAYVIARGLGNRDDALKEGQNRLTPSDPPPSPVNQ